MQLLLELRVVVVLVLGVVVEIWVIGIVDLFLLALAVVVGDIGSGCCWYWERFCCRYRKLMFGIGVVVVGNGSSFCWCIGR